MAVISVQGNLSNVDEHNYINCSVCEITTKSSSSWVAFDILVNILVSLQIYLIQQADRESGSSLML